MKHNAFKIIMFGLLVSATYLSYAAEKVNGVVIKVTTNLLQQCREANSDPASDPFLSQALVFRCEENSNEEDSDNYVDDLVIVNQVAQLNEQNFEEIAQHIATGSGYRCEVMGYNFIALATTDRQKVARISYLLARANESEHARRAQAEQQQEVEGWSTWALSIVKTWFGI